MAPRDDDTPTAHEWLVTLGVPTEEPNIDTPERDERVPAVMGGVDVGMMSADDRTHYVVISDGSGRVVWMRNAREVRGVKRCAGE